MMYETILTLLDARLVTANFINKVNRFFELAFLIEL